MILDISHIRIAHIPLFDGSPCILGEIHKLFVLSENKHKKINTYIPNVYYWWIFENDSDLDELKLKTTDLLENLEKLKTDILFSKSQEISSYGGLIKDLRDFCTRNETILQDFLDFVTFLFTKDPLSVKMLYNLDIWRSDKNDKVSRHYDEIPEDKEFFKYLIEFAIGVHDGDFFQIIILHVIQF